MKTNDVQNKEPKRGIFGGKHPIWVNFLLIVALAVLGLFITYFSLALFTKHGQTTKVPNVENLNYSDATQKLHDAGFRVEIRDSLYRDDLRPGIVIEQFPKYGEIAKPGRKVFLYINALHPKQVMIDEEDRPGLNAMRGMPYRSALAHLQELGFKSIKVVYVLGDNMDMVVRVLADGRPVRKRQIVPVTARIVLEVYNDGLNLLFDSLYNLEMLRDPMFNPPVEPSLIEEEESESPYQVQPSTEESGQGTYHYEGEGGGSEEGENETIGL